jgi:D-serine deaminase-like pyridoxal phosphate-dependent protein
MMDATRSHPPLDLLAVLSLRLDGRTKGMPHLEEPFSLGTVGALGLSADDLPLPIMVLRERALEHNLALMANFCAAHGVVLAPHGKTTMAPQLWERQMAAGAWGLTAASVSQARVMREVGVRRIVLANQLVDQPSVRWVASQMDDPHLTFLCLVDSVDGVTWLDGILAAMSPARRLPVLVEMGHAGGRTGCRSVTDGVVVADAVGDSVHLELAGVETFEGTVGTDRSPTTLDAVGSLLEQVRMLALEVSVVGSFTDEHPMVVSAGGSAFFDVVVQELQGDRWGELPVQVLLRSGCYLTHDHGFYGALAPSVSVGGHDTAFSPALELRGAVLSRPEADLAILGFGKRDAPFDLGLPIPLSVRERSGVVRDLAGRATIEAMNDQHAYLRIDQELLLGVGDVIRCGVSHPCTAMDRWRVIPVIDDADRVLEAVATFF